MEHAAGKLLDRPESIAELDSGRMLDKVETLSSQCEEAWEVGRKARMPSWEAPANVVVLGMGGSAIAGDMARAVLAGEAGAQISANRNYDAPGFVGPRSIVIASSYSGNTEETLEAASRCAARGARMVAITSGGELAARAKSQGWPLIIIPGGYSPRAALGYCLMPLLAVLEKVGVATDLQPSVNEVLGVLTSIARTLGGGAVLEANPAKQLALRLTGKVPVVYGAVGIGSVAAYRWKCQVNENSKNPAYWHELPELNHNEIMGWEAVPAASNLDVVMLRSEPEPPRLKLRAEVTGRILEEALGAPPAEIWSRGASPLARLLSLVSFGDFVSVYLAFLKRVDPTPIRSINRLKASLAAR